MNIFYSEHGEEIRASILMDGQISPEALKNALIDAFCKLPENRREEYIQRAADENNEAKINMTSEHINATSAGCQEKMGATKQPAPLAVTTPLASSEPVLKILKENHDNFSKDGSKDIASNSKSLKKSPPVIQSAVTVRRNAPEVSKRKESEAQAQQTPAGKLSSVKLSNNSSASKDKVVPAKNPAIFFLTPAEKEVRAKKERDEKLRQEQIEREQQIILKQRKEEQDLQEMIERRRIEDSRAFVSRGAGENTFFALAKESISAGAEARLSRRDNDSGKDDVVDLSGPDTSEFEWFPHVQHIGLPDFAYLTTHCSPRDGTGFTPIARDKARDSPRTTQPSTTSGDSFLNEMRNRNAHVYERSLGAIDHTLQLTLAAHFTSYVSSLLPEPVADQTKSVIDLSVDESNTKPKNCEPDKMVKDCAFDAAELVATYMRSPNVCDQTLVERYKPTTSEEYIGNESSIMRLEEWLLAWAEKNRIPTSKRKRENARSRSRGKYEEDSSSEEDADDICNVATLYGPSGSGKTGVLSTLAKKIGFNVIEIGTTELRSGAAIKKMVSEATKSHGVLFEKQKKRDHVSIPNLIVFDEVDLDFEEDIGFHTAIQTLAKDTFTPIVLTAENRHLPLLDNIHTEMLFFDKPPAVPTNDYITKVIRAADIFPSDSDAQLAAVLSSINGYDIRRILNQLHLLIRSCPSRKGALLNGVTFERYLSDQGCIFSRFDKLPVLLEASAHALVHRVQTADPQVLTHCHELLQNSKHELFTPAVHNISPQRGNIGGGFLVFIEGKHFLQRVGDERARINVYVGDHQVTSSQIRVMSDSEIAFIAPGCPAGSLYPVVVALEIRFALNKGHVLLRSDSRGMAGALHFDTPSKSDIRHYFDGANLRKGNDNQLTLTVKRGIKRTNDYVDDSSDEERSAAALTSQSSSTTDSKVLSDDERVIEVQDESPPLICSGAKKRRLVINEDDDAENAPMAVVTAIDTDLHLTDKAIPIVCEEVHPSAEEMARIIYREGLNNVMKHVNACAFLAPVNGSEAPDYSTIVAHPMDLGTIHSKLVQGVYSADNAAMELEALVADVRLVWLNCLKYNQRASALCTAAQVLCEMFERSATDAAALLGITLPAFGAFLVPDNSEDSKQEEIAALPESESESTLLERLTLAENERAKTNRSKPSFGSAGEEFAHSSHCRTPALPPGIFCKGELHSTATRETIAVQRGDVAALEALSSVRDLWAASDLFEASSLRADIVEDVDDANMRTLCEPIARCLAAANLGELLNRSLQEIRHSAHPPEADIASCAFLKSFEIQQVSSTEFSTDAKLLPQQNTHDEPVISGNAEAVVRTISKSTSSSAKHLLSDASEEEAEFNESGSDGNSSDKCWTSDTKPHRGSSESSTLQSKSNYKWKDIGVAFEKGYLRFRSQRDAYVQFALDTLSFKALMPDQWRRWGNGMHALSRHVVVETIPLVGKMLEWETILGVCNVENCNRGSRRSIRAMTSRRRFPYLSRVTKFSDSELDKIMHFAVVGQPFLHETVSPWE